VSELNYSIVIPCYASGAWMEELVQRIEAAMKPFQSFELILVNDKSPDDTWNTIQKLAHAYPFVRGIDLLYNVGQFRATLCGIENASGKFIITMDDDLQHPPEELAKLIKTMSSNPSIDCIMGEYLSKKHDPLRNLGSYLVREIMNFLYGKPRNVVTTSFRIMPASFAKSLCLYRIASPQLGPLIISLTKKIKNIPVEHNARKRGKSGYGMFRCVSETLRSVINASVLPLRLFSGLGFCTALIAFAISLFFFIRWCMKGVGVAGFTSLILTISFFSGMMLAGIGILGEYIGRIIQEITGLPRYQIRVDTGAKHD